MFKVGDKVIYISATTYRFTKNEVYTIAEIYNIDKDKKIYYIINGIETYINNFRSLKEYRKMKLEKINEKQKI